ncbi:MAG: hypothetical protein LUD27_05775 [Clostridia bacterium]|nr:hypothetical protein [Clostridia bacterium]
MKRRTKILSLLAAGAVTSTAVFSGCSLVSTNPQADMEQVIATVDITSSIEDGDDLYAYTSAISEEKEITKRDLVAYFISAGYSYLSSGSTYGETFETLAEALVDNEILIQYSVMATLYDMVDTEYDKTALTTYSSKTEVEAYEWLLDYQSQVISEKSGEDAVDYSLLCKYSIYQSVNNSIDSYEEDILDIDDDSESSSATLPTNVDTEVDNYYPVTDNGDLDYGIYTGYTGALIGDSGTYSDDMLEGSNYYTRAKAYNKYIQVLDANYLILDDEDVTDVYSLNYIQNQYLTLLREQLVSNYYEIYELKFAEKMLDSDGDGTEDYTYLQNRYDVLKAQQSSDYTDSSSYSSALSNMSSSSFVLYSPEGGTFGYVYNILAQFTTSQSSALTSLSTMVDNDLISQDDYYYERNQLLKNVTTYDQRSSWFNGGIDYSFDATEYYTADEYYGNSDYLFFEDNLTDTTRYESLENYYGKYAFNGTAILNEDEETYTIITNKLDVDGLLGEFEGYINFVLGLEGISGTASSTKTTDYYLTTTFTDGNYSSETDGVIDYSKFIYAIGEVAIDETFDMADLTNINSSYYTIMSAVNELQYAYTTDTSILSTYVGYSLAYTGEGTTSYVLEFEYAAKDAIERAAVENGGKGAGTYCVVATDYGWHLIYVTATLTAGETYTPDWSRVKTEGTFEYNFYEMLKETDIESASSEHQQNLIVKYYNDCVTIYEDTFEDLTSLTTTLS